MSFMATIITRHGGESHVVRPDRVYRTSVLTPIVGFQPSTDVQANAMAFTQGPPGMMSLAGLRGFGATGPGWFKRLGLRAQAAFAQMRAKKFMGVSGLGDGSEHGPAIHRASQIAPQIAAQMQMLAMMGPKAGGGPQASAYAYATRRNNTYYNAG